MRSNSSANNSLPGQHRSTARRTVGLELALIDAAHMRLTALEPSDPRSVDLRVAGPAALIVAKLVKLEERMGGPRPERVLTKDAADILRLLRYTDAVAIGARLRSLAVESTAAPVIETSLAFLSNQLRSRRSSLVDLAITATSLAEPAAQVRQAFNTLAQRLLDAFDQG